MEKNWIFELIFEKSTLLQTLGKNIPALQQWAGAE